MRLLTLMFLCAAAFAQSNPLTQAVTARYNSAKQNLLGAAGLMPEADYSFKLTPEQRPFAAWIEHTAMGNYSFCSGVKGEKAPEMTHGLTKKDELQKFLQASFTYCDEALASAGDQKALTEINGKYPVTSMISLVCSLNEHYGNLVSYLRMKGLTPPSSAHK
jgi:hypothetical protein